jgi:hypothetical protein
MMVAETKVKKRLIFATVNKTGMEIFFEKKPFKTLLRWEI